MEKLTPELIKKAGQLLEQEHCKRASLEKQAKASELAFKQIELGLCAPFKTYMEYMDKVASLMEKDLKVVEEAMAMGLGDKIEVGHLESSERMIKSDSLTDFIING